ncbi:MAG: PEP-CTERM sorting domain-containing protein [Rubrivivax sp.]|nr:PEP-CTERM sorting domain-containing protein [Rubrivivax sp.]
MNLITRLRIGAVTLACLSTSAFAAPVVFSYTGAMQSFTATVAGTYVVTAVGAQGGHGTISGMSFVGGRGASLTGSFDLAAGDTFWLVVGGAGSSFADSYNGGGGGGSFFVSAGGSPLLVAGGGGGIRAYASQNGCDALTTSFGGVGSGSSSSSASACGAKTDDLGLGGDVLAGSWGSAGAGFYGDGANDGTYGQGGKRWAAGMLGGADGVFNASYCTSVGGFGGGGSGSGCGGGGGGGGYSGGNGGFIAGGGGSWNTGYDQISVSGVGYGNGMISIDFAGGTVPEPSSLALLTLALLGAAATTQRRRG